MNDKDKEALYTWIDNDALSPDETALFKGMSDQERVIFAIERTWKAACDYKDKEIMNEVRQTPSGVSVVKFNKELVRKEIEKLQAKNKKLREALEKLSLYVSYNGDTWVQEKAREALKKVDEE
jgi:ribosomal protein L13